MSASFWFVVEFGECVVELFCSGAFYGRQCARDRRPQELFSLTLFLTPHSPYTHHSQSVVTTHHGMVAIGIIISFYCRLFGLWWGVMIVTWQQWLAQPKLSLTQDLADRRPRDKAELFSSAFWIAQSLNGIDYCESTSVKYIRFCCCNWFLCGGKQKRHHPTQDPSRPKTKAFFGFDSIFCVGQPHFWSHKRLMWHHMDRSHQQKLPSRRRAFQRQFSYSSMIVDRPSFEYLIISKNLLKPFSEMINQVNARRSLINGHEVNKTNSKEVRCDHDTSPSSSEQTRVFFCIVQH